MVGFDNFLMAQLWMFLVRDDSGYRKVISERNLVDNNGACDENDRCEMTVCEETCPDNLVL